MWPGRKREVVVITGASAGVGRAVVREFAKRKARIGLMARNLDGLEAARHEVEALGGEALSLPVDVSDPAQVESAASVVEDAWGPMDVWVNNAMVSVFSPGIEITPDEYHRVTDVTYHGYVHGTLAALKRMLPRDHGTIVQVGSVLAYRGIPFQAAYCGAKHAIQGFTESIRCELLHADSRVHITMVQLPGVNTPQFEWIRSRMPRKCKPVGAYYEPEVAARSIYYAAHRRRREIFVGWPTVEALQANKFMAGWLDRYLARYVYEHHQTNEPEDPNRPDNLFDTVPGDHGARGPYSQGARDTSAQAWANRHRVFALALAGAVAGVGWLAARAARQQHHEPDYSLIEV